MYVTRRIRIQGKQNQFKQPNNMGQLKPIHHPIIYLKNSYNNVAKRQKPALNLGIKKKCSAKKNCSLISKRINFNAQSFRSSILTARAQTQQYKMQCSLQNLSNINFLCRHKITEQMRKKMIDWMLQVFNCYHLTNDTFFLCVHLMDEYFRQCQQILRPSELHLIGITCIFMATKYEEIYPLKLKAVYEYIAHRKFKTKEIVSMQAQILETIHYKIVQSPVYTQLHESLNFVIYKTQSIGNYHEKLTKICINHLKCAIFQINLYYNNTALMVSKMAILSGLKHLIHQQNSNKNNKKCFTTAIQFYKSTLKNQIQLIQRICKLLYNSISQMGRQNSDRCIHKNLIKMWANICE